MFSPSSYCMYRPGLSDTAAAGNLLSALVGQHKMRLEIVTGAKDGYYPHEATLEMHIKTLLFWYSPNSAEGSETKCI